MDVTIVSFTNKDRRLLKRFVDFHWTHYRDDEQYVPLLDYEYLGNKLIGMTGFFEPSNLFFNHARMVFFLAMNGDRVVGRCNAFVNHNHNAHWNDRVGFFGEFESIDDPVVAETLLQAAASWLRDQGMNVMRGPQNLPVNEATPGCLTQGFDAHPVIYYHYNKPYYPDVLLNNGFQPVKKVMSWRVSTREPMVPKLERVANKVIDRYKVTFETWGERSFAERKREMLEVYNDAWSDNYGFVPFTREEFYTTMEDLKLVLDEKLFLFVYVDGELGGFFGGVPNIMKRMRPFSWCRRCELLRAAKMLLTKHRVDEFRFGYMGVRKKFRRLGLDSVMLWRQKQFTSQSRYRYAEIGWVLEDNVLVNRVLKWMNCNVSRVYTLFEKRL